MKLNHRGLGTGCGRGRVLLAGALLLATGATALWSGSSASLAGGSVTANAPLSGPLPAPTLSSQRQILAAYGQLPLFFEPNQGQSDGRVKFLARGSGYGLFLTADEAVLTLRAGRRRDAGAATVVRMKLAGANPKAEVSGHDPLPGKSNYFIGNDGSQWRRNVPQFARVRYQQVYPGIDLVYYGKQGQLEYDFEVAPGADPRRVALSFQDAEKLRLENGDLVMDTAGGSLRFHALRIYQRAGDEEQPVPGQFVLRAGNQVGFEVGAYDRQRALIIDPVLSYSSYLGGSGAETFATMAVDSAFNFYVTGSTTSADFPLPASPPAPTPLQATLNGAANVFIAKFNPAGSAPLVFATYLGGNGTDASVGIALDTAFNVYVAGTTSSTNFPTTSSAYQTTAAVAGNHAFLSELKPDGTALLYSTYLAGGGTDTATGIAVDIKGKAYLTGTTTSTNFPVTTGALQAAPLAANQFFVSKIDPTSSGTSSLAYSTYFGGGNPANGAAQGGGIAVDSNSNVYITGGTNFLHTGTASTDFPILNAAQGCLDSPTNPSSCPTNVTALDAFVAKINPSAASGAQLMYSTYVGGTGDDIGNGIAVDAGGNAYITGSTTSTDFTIPTTIKPYQPAHGSGAGPDAFVAKINNPSSGSVAMTYFTYLGGSGNDTGLAIAVDAIQNVRVTGSTDSTDFPLLSTPPPPSPPAPIQGALGGGTDAFVARIDTTTTSASTGAGEFATYLGGSGNDRGTGIAVDAIGNTYVAGDTASANFPTVAPLQGSLSGPRDAFVSKLGAVSDLSVSATATPSPVGVGNQVTFKFTVTNNGPDTTTGATFTDILPSSGATFVSAAASPGSCTAPSGTPSTVTCAIGTMAAGSTATVTMIFTATTAGTISDSGTVSVNANNSIDPNLGNNTASASAPVTDFSVSAAPASITVAAGSPASYTVTVTPIPTYSGSVSLSCSAGLPVQTSCQFSTNPVTIPSTSAVTSSLTINTTARPITSQLAPGMGPIYATWLPISGLALLGLGIGGVSRKRRLLGGLLLGGMLALIVLQAACGASSKKTIPTGGTPAGTYTITVSGSSGGASRTTTVTLVVQ